MGSVPLERMRVLQFVKANVDKRMVRLLPKRDIDSSNPAIKVADARHHQRWWRVDFNDGSHRWYTVEMNKVVISGTGPIEG